MRGLVPGELLANVWYNMTLPRSCRAAGNAYNQTDVPSGQADVLQIALGNSHTCALTNNGTVVCWGKQGAVRGLWDAIIGPSLGLVAQVSIQIGSPKPTS